MQAGFFTSPIFFDALIRYPENINLMKCNYLLLLLVALVLASCNTDRYITINTNVSASVTFKSDSTRILIINGFNFESMGVNNEKKLDVIKDGAYTSLNYAATKLSQLKGVNMINIADTNHLTISIDSMTVVAERYHADYVLVLNKFNAYFGADNFQTRTVEIDHKKQVIKTADFNMQVTANYTLFNRDGSVNRQLNGYVSDLTTNREVPGALLVSLSAPSLKSNGPTVNQSAVHATDKALQCFFTYTNNYTRYIYGNNAFESFAGEMAANNFNRADSLLQPMLVSEDPELSSKAAYNKAVIYEAKGDTANAKNMAQKSLDRNDNRLARYLLRELGAN